MQDGFFLAMQLAISMSFISILAEQQGSQLLGQLHATLLGSSWPLLLGLLRERGLPDQAQETLRVQAAPTLLYLLGVHNAKQVRWAGLPGVLFI